MVFFVCEGCNESLKKNKVDQHASRCSNCWAVTCVDCNKTFEGDDYAQHNTCISEAEKYEKALYRPSASAKKAATKKKNAQEQWVDAVAEATSPDSNVMKAINQIQQFDNVPRKKPKFINFAKNCLRLRDASLYEKVWEALEKSFAEQKRQQEAAGENGGNQDTKSGESIADSVGETESQAQQPTDKLEIGNKEEMTTDKALEEPSAKKHKEKKKQENESKKDKKDAGDKLSEDSTDVVEEPKTGTELVDDKKARKSNKKRKAAEEEEKEHTTVEKAEMDTAKDTTDSEETIKVEKKRKHKKSKTEEVKMDEQESEKAEEPVISKEVKKAIINSAKQHLKESGENQSGLKSKKLKKSVLRSLEESFEGWDKSVKSAVKENFETVIASAKHFTVGEDSTVYYKK